MFLCFIVRDFSIDLIMVSWLIVLLFVILKLVVVIDFEVLIVIIRFFVDFVCIIGFCNYWGFVVVNIKSN